MPLYEYVCPKCEFRFELLRPLSQASESASCPRCYQGAERILSSFACFSTDEGGLTTPVGGSACASCSTSSCDTCSL